MSSRDRVLVSVFEEPPKANIAWSDVEALLLQLGAEMSEGRGSRVRFSLNGVRAVFHRPHPQKECSKPLVRSIRRFLTEAGIH